ncbi:MAG: hypothetical protein J4G04_02840 [Nitrosopumilaceae archaeon]|nr:hypothetical protein [Nitrosopumilaceae archaeon]
MNRTTPALAALAAGLALAAALSAAAPVQAQDIATEYIPIDGIIQLERTTILMHVPADNPFPWGHVRGTIQSHAEGYDVIIQVYQDGMQVHLAQVGVQEDGSYEYRFRALDVTDGEVTRVFEGDYEVVIFKVVHVRAAGMV